MTSTALVMIKHSKDSSKAKSSEGWFSAAASCLVPSRMADKMSGSSEEIIDWWLVSKPKRRGGMGVEVGGRDW